MLYLYSLLSIGGIAIVNYLQENAVGAIVGGVLGNRADAIGKRIFDSCLAKIAKLAGKPHLPDDNELLKAIRIAEFNATSYLIRAFFEQLKHASKDTGKGEYELIYEQNHQLLEAWLRKSRKALSEVTPASADIHHEMHTLFLDHTGGLTQAQQVLKARMKDVLIKNIETDFAKPLPSLLKSMIMDGWNEDGVKMDWVDLISLFFWDTVNGRRQGHIRAAFENRVLSDIDLDNKKIQISLNTLGENYASMAELLNKKLPLIESILYEQTSHLVEIKEDVGQVRREIEDLRKAFSNTSSNITSVAMVASCLDEIRRSESEVTRKFEEMKEIETDLQESPNDKYIAKALAHAETEWRGETEKLLEFVERFRTMKSSILRQKEVFDGLDLKTTSERLQQAKALFDKGDFKAVEALLTLPEREAEIAKRKNEYDVASTSLQSYAREELIIAEMKLMDHMDDDRVVLAERSFRKSVEIYPLFDNCWSLGDFLYQRFQEEEGRRYLEKALLCPVDRSESRYFTCLTQLADILYKMNDEAGAAKYINLVVKTAGELDSEGDGTRYTAIAHYTVGNFLQKDHRFEEANSSYEKALEIWNSKPRDLKFDEFSLLNLRINYAQSLMWLNREAEAEKILLPEYARWRDAIADVPADDYARLLSTLSGVYLHSGKQDKALVFLEKELRASEVLASYDPDKYDEPLSNTFNSFGVYFINEKRYQSGLDYFYRSLKIREALFQKEPSIHHYIWITALVNISEALVDLKDFDQLAEFIDPRLSTARDIYNKFSRVHRRHFFVILKNAAHARIGSDDYEGAEALLLESLSVLEILQKEIVYRTWASREPYEFLILVYIKTNKTDKLFETYAKLISIYEEDIAASSDPREIESDTSIIAMLKAEWAEMMYDASNQKPSMDLLTEAGVIIYNLKAQTLKVAAEGDVNNRLERLGKDAKEFWERVRNSAK